MAAYLVKSLELVDSVSNGRPTIAIHLDGQEVATIRGLHRRFGVWLLRPEPKLVVNPNPQGGCWTLPLPEAIDLLEDVCKRFGLQERNFRPDVSGTFDGQGHVVKIGFKRQWAEVRRFEEGEQVIIAENATRFKFPLLKVKSDLRRALLVSRSADPWVPSDVTMDDFGVAKIAIGAKVLVKGEKWIEVTRREKSGLWMRTFARSNCSPWTMPYEAVVTMLVEVRSRLTENHDDRGRCYLERRRLTKGIKIAPYVCSPSEREWLTVSLELVNDNIPIGEWAEIDQEGPELQIQMYAWDDLHWLELPLDHVIDRLRDAKVALLGTANRPPVRRPLVAGLGLIRTQIGRDAERRAEESTFIVRQVPSGLAAFYGGRLFANLPFGAGTAFEVEAPPGGAGWSLPFSATMDALGELLARARLEEADAKPREDIVFCAGVVGGGTAAAIRFRDGLRAEVREHSGETRIHIGSGENNPRRWRLSLPQAIATLRWALAMLRAAEPWAETNATSEDFTAVSREDGLDLHVAGEIWTKVRPSGAEVRMEFMGRADMRPWILPYETVVNVLANAEETVLAEVKTADRAMVADRWNVEPDDQLETLREWQSAPPDRAGLVVGYYYRDEDCWVQWAEVDHDGREPQVEFYSWPGCRRFAFPIREVIHRLGEARAMFPDSDG